MHTELLVLCLNSLCLMYLLPKNSQESVSLSVGIAQIENESKGFFCLCALGNASRVQHLEAKMLSLLLNVTTRSCFLVKLSVSSNANACSV